MSHIGLIDLLVDYSLCKYFLNAAHMWLLCVLRWPWHTGGNISRYLSRWSIILGHVPGNTYTLFIYFHLSAWLELHNGLSTFITAIAPGVSTLQSWKCQCLIVFCSCPDTAHLSLFSFDWIQSLSASLGYTHSWARNDSLWDKKKCWD